MYIELLTIHSLFRWIVLMGLVFTVIYFYNAYRKGYDFTRRDKFIRFAISAFALIQMSFGLWLYFMSPLVEMFFNDMTNGIHQREIRFFAMEHSLMMLIAVITVMIGVIKSYKKVKNKQKFNVLYKWCLIALIIIILNIPWEFSPLVNRPSIRFF